MGNQPPEKRLSEIPMLHETEHIPIKEKIIYFHFFFASCDWFIAEFDGDFEMAEWEYVSYEFLRTVTLMACKSKMMLIGKSEKPQKWT